MSNNNIHPPVELLAPAGNMEVLHTVINSGADAVYLGGKNFNMRMHRRDLNFSRREIAEAVEFVHSQGKKIFITINSLYTDMELAALRSELRFLAGLNPDAFIVQDVGVISLVKELGIEAPLHASVMINVNNLSYLKALEEWGVERAILSRELSFAEVRELREKTDMVLEYFIHGDMCFSQSGQCYHSGMIFGQSSNRGRCMKPCRWKWKLTHKGEREDLNLDREGPYLLAAKDMCLFPFLPQLIESGIYSFKIEGRMRTPSYLSVIVKAYRKAIDAYLDNPKGYSMDKGEGDILQRERTRDFSPMYALGNPGATSIAYDGKREPKVFSTTIAEERIQRGEKPPLPPVGDPEKAKAPLLSVRVGTWEALNVVIKAGPDRVYLGGENFYNIQDEWGSENIKKGIDACQKSGVQALVASPRIIHPRDVGTTAEYFRNAEEAGATGLLVTSIGSARLAREETQLPVYLDYGLNIFNTKVLEILQDFKIEGFTAQPEMSFSLLAELIMEAGVPVEILGHGPQPAMISDHCLLAGVLEGKSSHDACSKKCLAGLYDLVDEKEQAHPLYFDTSCRTHIFLSKELCVLPYIKDFLTLGVSSLRLELGTYQPEEAALWVRAYRQEIESFLKSKVKSKYTPQEEAWQIMESSSRDFNLGGYVKGVSLY